MSFLKFSWIMIVSFSLFFGCKEESSTPAPKAAASAGAAKKELKLGITQEFENLNLIIAQMLATSYMYKMVGRTLTTIDPDGNWVPKLVKKIPTIEDGDAKLTKHNGKDVVEASWEIHEKATWGDGTPVTGHDVAFSIKVGKSDTVSVGEKEVYSQVEQVVVDPQNPKKFKFIYDKPRWDYYHLGTLYIVPRHLEEPIYNKYGSQPQGYEKNTLYVKEPTNPGLYMGPYKVAELKLGSHIVFTRNKTWYGETPKLDKITVKLIPNTATLEANLRSGTIDMISVLGLQFDQALKFEKTVKAENLPFNVNFKPSLVYEHIDLNLRNPFLKDVRVRKALVYGINRDDLVQALFEGKQFKAIHNLATIDPWYTDKKDDIVLYPYSPRKAKKLLEEAGWKLDLAKKDGYRYKDGQKLSFQLMTTSGNKTRELVQTYLQDQWKKIGVEITIKNEPARVYFGETVRKGKYPAMALFAWISSPENSPKSTLASKNIPSKENGYSGQNSGGWTNKEVDHLLLNVIDKEFNAEERKKIMKKVLYHYTNEVPVIPLYYRADISVTPKTMSGYRLPGHQFSATNHIEKWTW